MVNAMTEQSRDLQADLRAVIERTILAHPRSAQVAIGPSEIGTPCVRKLGHKLAGTPGKPERPAWRPTVGTAVHSWLHQAFVVENTQLGWDRWLLETKVYVGDIGGEMISGSLDVYDQLTHTVIDWKVPGITTIKAARAAKSPGPQYRVQVHGYGLGVTRFGFPVEHVAIYFLPAAGELGDGYYWTEPYDAQIALDALARADGVAQGIASLGAAAMLPLLPMADDHCSYCSWWEPGSTDPATSCAGFSIPKASAPALTLTR